MIHIAAGFLLVSVTFFAVILASFLIPGAPSVDAPYVTYSCIAMVNSSALFWFVRRYRL